MSDVPGSPKVTRCTSKPTSFRRRSRTPSAPASAGVTEGQRTRSRVMETASFIPRLTTPKRRRASLVRRHFERSAKSAATPRVPDDASRRRENREGPANVLIPQQLVDAGLGAGALVDALDDHGAGGRRAGLAVLQRARRQRARNDHGIFRNFDDESLAGVAVDDFGGSAEEHAHR